MDTSKLATKQLADSYAHQGNPNGWKIINQFLA
jgi:hypothetical protein